MKATQEDNVSARHGALKPRLWHSFLSLFLTLTCLVSWSTPSFALRPRQSGLEEPTDTNRQLYRALTAGLEEVESAAGLEEASGEVVEAQAAVSSAEAQLRQAATETERAIFGAELMKAEGQLEKAKLTGLEEVESAAGPEQAFAGTPTALSTQAGLEAEGVVSSRPDLKEAVFLSFDPASGVALTQAGLEARHLVVQVADTPTTVGVLKELSVDPSRMVGLLWAGLEETDYLALGVKSLVGADPTLPGWQDQVKRIVSRNLGPGVRIIPVYDTGSLAAGLESIGASKGMIERVLQLKAGAEEALALAV